MKRRLMVGLGAAVLVGLAVGHAGAQSNLLTPASSNTINGQSTSVFATSLNGGGGLAATGQVAYPQAFPEAVHTNSVPGNVQTIALTGTSLSPPLVLGVGGDHVLISANSNPLVPTAAAAQSAAPSVQNYSCATYRPDFQYQANRLAFAAQSTSSLGQIDMSFWPGLPAGTQRYVPLGEY